MRLAKVLRVASVLVAVVSLSTFGTPAASARSAGVVEFAGAASLACPGLGYPGTPVGTTDLSPNNCPFVLTAIACADQIVNVLKGSKPPVVAGITCSVGATGTVTGFCGLSYGKGSGTFTDSTGNTAMIPTFSFTAVGGTLVVTGVASKPSTGQKGFLSGVVEAVPPTAVLTPLGGSCPAKTATTFTIVGAVLFTLI